MAPWTPADMPADLTGKSYVITGTSSGIGTHIAHELAKRGAKVVAGNRSTDKANEAMAALRADGEELHGFSTRALDLSSLASVRDFAAQLQSNPLPR